MFEERVEGIGNLFSPKSRGKLEPKWQAILDHVIDFSNGTAALLHWEQMGGAPIPTQNV